MIHKMKFGDLEIVVADGIICSYSIAKYFIKDKSEVRLATKEEICFYNLTRDK